jgi:hypothetical protein
VSTTANTAQREYWNTIAGPRWVGLEGFVERRVQAVNDLLPICSGVAAGERVLDQHTRQKAGRLDERNPPEGQCGRGAVAGD